LKQAWHQLMFIQKSPAMNIQGTSSPPHVGSKIGNPLGEISKSQPKYKMTKASS